MFKCLREISSQGLGAVGERLAEEVLKCTVSTVTVDARVCDSITVICYQGHKIQIKRTALKWGLQLWVYFSSHLQSNHRCLKEPRAALHSRLSLALPIDTTTLFKKRQGGEKKKEGRSTLPCTEKIQWRSTEETSNLFFFVCFL